MRGILSAARARRRCQGRPSAATNRLRQREPSRPGTDSGSGAGAASVWTSGTVVVLITLSPGEWERGITPCVLPYQNGACRCEVWCRREMQKTLFGSPCPLSHGTAKPKSVSRAVIRGEKNAPARLYHLSHGQCGPEVFWFS